MAHTFKALSALLTYPTAELQAAVDELKNVLAREKLLSAKVLRQLDGLIDELATGDIYDLQERYVLLFDRSRSLSLHLFEHVHGEGRDRGQAMVDLQNLYAEKGMEVSAAELPDFVPLFLEFLSTRPVGEACELLGQPAHIISALAERLRKRKSAYESVFRALAALAKDKPKDADIAVLLAQEDIDPLDLAALDAAWESEPVTFGPGATGCKDGLIARLRAAKRPATGA
jgi:nitrate reductase delta subunit